MKISIITVNLNNSKGLNNTILSVINQTYKEYEYIIIDGNSSDNSCNIIRQYEKYIHYWISEPDEGIYDGMNKGIKRATGEYIIFMNSGDCFINKDVLSIVFSKKRTADFLVGYTVKNWGKIKEKYHISNKMSLYTYMIGNTLPHQGTWTKRKLFDEVGLYDNRFLCADWKFHLLCLFKYNKTIEIIEEDIALLDTTGVSNSKEGIIRIRKERKEILKECFPYLYKDYEDYYKIKRCSYHRIKRHILWRIKTIFFYYPPQ